jgi:hypothetical protein
MRRTATLLFLACAACARPAANAPAPATAPTAAPRAASAINAAALRRDISVFASDSFLGRQAGTPNAVKAAQFIASRLAQLGVEPAGDSGYFQRVPLVREVVGERTRFTVTTPRGVTDIPFGPQLLPILAVGDNAPLPRLSAEGDLVFAGYGLSLPELGRDDLAGLDVAGKVVVFVNDAPPSLDAVRRAELQRPDSLGHRLGILARRKPAGIIVLATGQLAAQLPMTALELTDSTLKLGAPADAPRELPMILFGQLRPDSPLLPAGWPSNDRAQPLQGRRFNGTVELARQEFPTYNVVGVVRGRDSTLNHSYVAYGAHLDHIGVLPTEAGDSIANGADDDGSGSMALLAIARAATLAPERPRRSLLFVWHTGEELGLFGSEWFTSHPTVPLDSVIAQLNADMIGRNAPDSLYLVGPNAAPNGQSRALGAIIDSVNSALPRPFQINREWDSPTHPEQIYYRSDHYNYAKHGVPIVFFTSGLHADYHRVSDEPSKLDYDKLARVAKLIYESGVAVANRPTRPLPSTP